MLMIERLKGRAGNNILYKVYLVISTAAALALFTSPNKWNFLISSALFVIAVFQIFGSHFGFRRFQKSRFSLMISVSAVFLLYLMGYPRFIGIWQKISIVDSIANTIHLPVHLLIGLTRLVLFIAGFTALFYFVDLFFNFSAKFLEFDDLDHSAEISWKEISANLFSNSIFIVSAFAFLIMNCFTNLAAINWILPGGFVLLIAGSKRKIASVFNCAPRGLKIFSFLSAAGIVIGTSGQYSEIWSKAVIFTLFGIEKPVSESISLVFWLTASYVLYFFVLYFMNRLLAFFRSSKAFSVVTRKEWVFYAFVFMLISGLMVWSYCSTRVFYQPDDQFDFIYTSDSYYLFTGNSYTFLVMGENDLRQPLFAVFASPFMGFVSLFSFLLGNSILVKAILTGIVQIALLLCGVFLLGRAIDIKKPVLRCCFMALFSSAYMTLLFSVMIEQYNIAFFWLMTFLYAWKVRSEDEETILFGASGTMLTSVVLLPALLKTSPFSDFFHWVKKSIGSCLKFAGLMILCDRGGIIIDAGRKIEILRSFSGGSLPLTEKWMQYTNFVKSCIFAPESGVRMLEEAGVSAQISWQLDPVHSWNIMGLVILSLCLISFILNRKRAAARLSFGWILFSILLLVFVGWGTAENGLILYGLYFGWAFLVLLYLLIIRCFQKIRAVQLLPYVLFGSSFLLLMINLPCFLRMVQFGIQYYPA